MNQYTIFWLTGETQIVNGNTASEAMNNAGIGAGALWAMEFFAEGDKRNEYEFGMCAPRIWRKKAGSHPSINKPPATTEAHQRSKGKEKTEHQTQPLDG